MFPFDPPENQKGGQKGTLGSKGLNTINNTFHFDFSIVQAILKNLTSNLICLLHLLILKTVHTRKPEGNNSPA